MFFVSSFLSGISPRLFSNTNFSPFFTVTRLNSTLLKVQLPKIQIWINFVLCKSFVTRGLGLGFYCSTHSTPNVECDMLCFCQNAYHNKQLLLLLLQNRVLQAAGLSVSCGLDVLSKQFWFGQDDLIYNFIIFPVIFSFSGGSVFLMEFIEMNPRTGWPCRWGPTYCSNWRMNWRVLTMIWPCY